MNQIDYGHNPQAFLSNAPPVSVQAFPQSLYPGPQHRFQPAAHHQHGSSLGSGFAPNGGMMQQQQQQQQLAGPQNPYTTAPYSQSIPAPTGTPVQRAGTHSVSPPRHASPHVAGLNSQHVQAQTPQKGSMAAPSPARPQSGPQTPAKPPSQPQSPQSAQSAANYTRERERLALLLEINVELLHEINKLQSQGQGGATNPQQAVLFRAQGMPDKMASEDYLHTFNRLHANLGYLCAQSDTHQNKPGQKPPHPPNYMMPPPNMPGLSGKYATLRKLFPDWTARDVQPMNMNGAGAVTTSAPTPATASTPIAA